MKIVQGAVAAIEYTLRDSSGQVLDSSEGLPPLEYLHGFRNIVPGLERQLEGLEAGAAVDVVVEPAEAYGVRDERLVLEVPREQFPPEDEVQVGMKFHGQLNGGVHVLRVVAVGEEFVRVDANDELAGVELHFAVKVVSVREATEEELANGRPHQEDTCCHGHGHYGDGEHHHHHGEGGGCCGRHHDHSHHHDH